VTYTEVIKKLRSWSNARNVAGMARFGISSSNTLGIPLPKIRALAKSIGKDHALALQLWKSGIHEARILATIIDDPRLVTEKQMEQWVRDFDSWDVVDQAAGNLFDKTPFAYEKAVEWTRRTREFEKRAGFSMMAYLAVHDKKAPDEKMTKFLPIIKKAADDERNFVRKAVNWALRQIGKRNKKLNRLAIKTAKEIQKVDSKSAHWIAADALRELQSPKTQARLKK
jgi:3-methyladenine DNA glycosylase AlkD